MKRIKNNYGFTTFETIFVIVCVLLIVLIGFLLYRNKHDNKAISTTVRVVSVKKVVSPQTASSQIPSSVNPVNPAAVPLGDGKVASSPKVGYVDSCITNFPQTGGASVDGPWINETNKTWDSLTKVAVEGSVNWPNAYYTNTISGTSRMITTNDLPLNHPSGTFPISKSDPAYSYDQNPNSIKAQPTMWMLPANPTTAAQPSCTSGGPVGILTDGVFLFNALDGEGRDAGAHEVLDGYQGHPDSSDMYHHHVIPNFLLGNSSDKNMSKLIGYAADGYGIYVERDSKGNLLTNANLDVCHGRTSEVVWNGKETDIYHYDATLEYPYAVGCFHGAPVKTTTQMKM
jgi:hypothetical protein